MIRRHRILQAVHVLLLLFLSATTAIAGVKRLSLAAAIQEKLVQVDAVNVAGAYQGITTEVIVTNTSADVVQIKIDMGTIFAPDSGRYQPMVLVNEEMLMVQAGKTGRIKVQTFCGAAARNCPARDHRYRWQSVMPDTLLPVLRFIKQNNLFDELGQSAIWAVTGGAELSGVYDYARPELSSRLLTLVCKAVGKPMPDYYTVNAPMQQIPDQPAYVPKPLKIMATFRQILNAPKMLTLGVYNDKGEMIQKVFEHQEFRAAGHEFGVEFEAADVPSGTYAIRLTEGSTILQEKKVVVP